MIDILAPGDVVADVLDIESSIHFVPVISDTGRQAHIYSWKWQECNEITYNKTKFSENKVLL